MYVQERSVCTFVLLVMTLVELARNVCSTYVNVSAFSWQYSGMTAGLSRMRGQSPPKFLQMLWKGFSLLKNVKKLPKVRFGLGPWLAGVSHLVRQVDYCHLSLVTELLVVKEFLRRLQKKLRKFGQRFFQGFPNDIILFLRSDVESRNLIEIAGVETRLTSNRSNRIIIPQSKNLLADSKLDTNQQEDQDATSLE